MDEARIASIHLGRPTNYIDAKGVAWRTALIKEAVEGPVHLSEAGPAGDAVADTRHHGGYHQAVMVYSRAHQAYWRERFGLEIGFGGLGENLSVEGLDDENVCIGDIFRAGSALLQVSQPRQPCNTLARYWQQPLLLPAIWETVRSGWYFRVLQEGSVRPGDSLERVERPHPEWTSARVLRAFRDGAIRSEEALAASELKFLTPGWKTKLQEKAAP
ncbi:MAG: MOSC domain-containing protein [Holophaga sp.]|nr:MOSC domain-containing protein [Holophaga sp.]